VRTALLAATTLTLVLAAAPSAFAKAWWQPDGAWTGVASWSLAYSWGEAEGSEPGETGTVRWRVRIEVPPARRIEDGSDPRPARLSLHGYQHRTFRAHCPSGGGDGPAEDTVRYDYEGPGQVQAGVGRADVGFPPALYVDIIDPGDSPYGVWYESGSRCGEPWSWNTGLETPPPFSVATEYLQVGPDCDGLFPGQHPCTKVSRPGVLERSWREACWQETGRDGCVMDVSFSFRKSAPGDRDGDRLPDSWERRYRLPTGRDSRAGDPDRDRLTNALEYRHRTNPRRRDTDGDGRSDGAEVKRHHTNPRKPNRHR
jgi:hypothetical protein